jgi:hypothetical protein
LPSVTKRATYCESLAIRGSLPCVHRVRKRPPHPDGRTGRSLRRVERTLLVGEDPCEGVIGGLRLVGGVEGKGAVGLAGEARDPRMGVGEAPTGE